jgi:DNA-binding MarR family transcriptional regulator
MTKRMPQLAGRDRPSNLALQLREAYRAINDLIPAQLVAEGFADFRPAHSNVFEYLDDTGTTVSTLAERANMTKQAMAELVLHLEQNDYVTRVPDPADRRAKLVRPTERGYEVFRVVQAQIPVLHARVARLIGAERLRELRRDLELIRAEFAPDDQP